MPAVVLVSAKGSPGVTTAAAALAAVATSAGSALLVELDPSGGSIQVLTGEPAQAGLVDAAGGLRRLPSPTAIDGTTVALPPGMTTLLAPASGPTAESVIASAVDRWFPALAPCAPHVLVDGGRWEPSQRSARRVVGADLVAVVCRPTVPGVESTHHILERLREQSRRPVVVVVVGDQPYPADQIAAHLDVPLAGTISWDPRGATSLWSDGPGRRWLRTVLARSAAVTLAGLEALAAAAGSPESPSGLLASPLDPPPPPAWPLPAGG